MAHSRPRMTISAAYLLALGALCMGAAQCGDGTPGVADATAAIDPSLCASKTCTQDPDCGSGMFCANRECHKLAHFCATSGASNALTVSANDRGETTDCTPYTCDGSTGRCLREAADSSECAPTWNWATPRYCAHVVTGGISTYLSYSGGDGPLTQGSQAQPQCAVECTADSACGVGMCWNNRCVSRNNYCEFNSATKQWQSIEVSGALGCDGNYARSAQRCGTFACNPSSGECYESCFNSSECVGGLSCHIAEFTCAQ